MKQILISLSLFIIPFGIFAQTSGEIKGDTLETIIVTAQLREQRVLDIPITLSTVSAQTLENTNTRDLEQLSGFVPGLNIRIQTPHRPTFVIRGLSSDEVSPTAQPRVSVYFNNIPASRASMALAELYDINRVEVAKGPQQTLFGRGAQIGAINFISQKPVADFGGYLSASLGNFAMKEIQGAVNIPVIKDKLLARVAGIYSYQDGYVKNLSGGDNLNGKNTFGGRFSLAYLPVQDLRFDLMVSYQKDDNPGAAFMSKRYPNSKGVSDIFTYEASLDSGKTWFNKRDVLLSSLDIRYDINGKSYLTSTTAFTRNTVDHHWDGDGTIAPAIDMAEGVKANQFTEELRYNLSLNDRLSGFVGVSYWREDVKQRYWFAPNEQYFAYTLVEQMLAMYPEYAIPVPPLISDNGSASPFNPPPTSILSAFFPSGSQLATNHEEENNLGAINQSYDIFADVTFKIIPKLSITAGIRGAYEKFKSTNEAHMVGDVPSTLGNMISAFVPEEQRTSPNVFFRPTNGTEVIEKDFLSLTYRLNLKYDICATSTAFVGYSRGRRPNVLQINTAGVAETLNSEQLHSFDAGFKWTALQRLWFDVGAFYQLYDNFQIDEWVPGGRETYDVGKATAYGAEVTAKAAIVKYLDVFGNYAYFHSRFDDEYTDGTAQRYAGNTFRLSPEHSFLVGFNAKVAITRNLQVIFTPTYSWKSHVWFEDSNAQQPENKTLDRLDQDAFGLLNANLAFKLSKPELTLSLFATNLLDEKYIIGAGNTGMMFGVPTYVPGAPRMFGGRLRWSF